MKFDRFLDSYRNPENELAEHIHSLCEEKLNNQERIKNQITSVEEWEIKRKEIKENLLQSIGLLNFEKCSLNVEVTGELDKVDYVIKKIIFESHYQFYVTANLYIPKNITKKLPAVIFTCGHSKEAKAEIKYQLAAIELVLNQMIVLVIDPPGQGETEQMPDRNDIKWGTQEHSYIGLASTLMGQNIIRYFIWNIIRATDYLYTLDFVDQEKIGIAGNSGGGTQSSYAICLEDRIKAAAIGCYITGRKQYLRKGHAHDSEQNIYNCMGIGFDYSDFITCASPKPIAVLSQQYDFFPIEGALYSVERAKKIYSLYGKEDNLTHIIEQNTHGLTDYLRIEMVKWYVKLFNNKKYVSRNPYMYLESEKNLQCTKRGQILYDDKKARTISELLYEDFKKNKIRTLPLADRIKKVFTIIQNKEPLLDRKINPFIYHGYEGCKIFWLSEKEVSVGGIYIKGEEHDRCTYLLFNEGTLEIEKHEELILQQLKKGDVFIFDPRGVGAFKSRDINNSEYYQFYGTISKLVNDSLMAGSSLIEMQMNDLLSSLNITKKEINIIAFGKSSLVGLLVNVISDRVKSIEVIKGIKTFDDIIKGEYDYIPEYEVFNMAKYFDVEELMI